MRRLPLYLCFLAVAAFVVGCGGHSSYTVETGGSGDLRGLRTDPADGDTNVRVDPTISVYWVTGYDPPPEFKFILRDDDGNKVYTIKKSSDDPNHWLFAPYEDLEYDSRYAIEVTYQDSSRTFIFRTEEEDGSTLFMKQRKTREADPGDSAPQLEHTVRTGL